MKQRTHRVVMTVTFNRPIGQRHAVRQVRDNIHGTFYPNPHDDKDADVMKIRTVKAEAGTRGWR